MHLLKRPLTKAFGRLALAASTLVFGFGVGSASAVSIPFFYLVPTGPGTLPTSVPTGSSTDQLWVDPSGVVASGPGAPGNCSNIVGAPACTGFYGIGDIQILAEGSLTMTAFTGVFPGTVFNLISGTLLNIAGTGDGINGNATAFEIGALTIANTGSGPGDVTLTAGDYLDTQFNQRCATLPQTLAAVGGGGGLSGSCGNGGGGGGTPVPPPVPPVLPPVPPVLPPVPPVLPPVPPVPPPDGGGGGGGVGVIPEPGALLLFGSGLAVVRVALRRARRSAGPDVYAAAS